MVCWGGGGYYPGRLVARWGSRRIASIVAVDAAEHRARLPTCVVPRRTRHVKFVL